MLATSESSVRPIASFGLEALVQPLAPHLAGLQAFLNLQIEEFEPEVRDLVDYCLRHSGKRIRPMLMFYAGWAGPDQVLPAHVQAAAVIELVHLATLVHDDILDGASMRHSSPTVAARYGSHAAVLVGDALFSQALKLASDFPSVAVCREVSLSTRRACEGEIAQTFRRGDYDLSRQDYFRIIDLKTAELFRVSCRLGALLAGYETAFCEAAGEFGRHLGRAYQIFDDVADLRGVEVQAGKTLGTDLASGKLTLPWIVALESATAAQKRRMLAALREGGPALDLHLEDPALWAEVRALFSGELMAAETLLIPFLDTLPPARALQPLTAFVRQQADRFW